jgi:hypothetical protein
MITPQIPETTASRWRKSSYSGSGNNCVEVAQDPGSCAVRDSKNPDGGHLALSAGAWQAFARDIKRGRYSGL